MENYQNNNHQIVQKHDEHSNAKSFGLLGMYMQG
jgi:hypothetical protein